MLGSSAGFKGDDTPDGANPDRNGGTDGKVAVANLAAVKRLPGEFLKQLGLHDTPRGIAIPYFDAAGNQLFERVRLTLAGKNDTRQPTKTAVYAYGSERIDWANKAGVLFVVEGESDCWTLWHYGLPALGIPGAGNAKVIEREHVEAVAEVYVLIEQLPDGSPDQGGEQFREGVPVRLSKLGFTGKVYELRMPDGLKDPSALHIDDPERFLAGFQECVKTARPVSLPTPARPSRHRQAPSPAENSTERNADRPRIVVGPDERRVCDEAVAALANEPTVFHRGNMLVRVLRGEGESRAVLRPVGSPVIVQLPQPSLREILADVACWEVERRSRNGEPASARTHPPGFAVSAVAARGCWPGVRHLDAVVEAPVLRADGTVLDRPGWDKATGLLYEPATAFPSVPSAPTPADAKAAMDTLLDLVIDFPFADSSHAAAWLAALLTPLARFAFNGPAPLFIFESNAPGSGKGLLISVIAEVVSGRDVARTAYPDRDEEMAKTITAVALAGDRIVLLDNIGDSIRFGSPSLDAALTATTWKSRILGRSELTPELPLSMTWFASGNNVSLKGDVHRRVVPCRLEVRVERPEERQGFKYPRLRDYVVAHRPRLVVAALTVLRAFVHAGRPPQGLTPLGSYEGWSDLVRAAVHWVTGRDPVQSRDGIQASDSGVSTLAGLLAGWSELPGGISEEGLTVAEAMRFLKGSPDQFTTLRDALAEWSRGEELPSTRIVGNKIRAIRGRVVSGQAFEGAFDAHTKMVRWRVREVGT